MDAERDVMRWGGVAGMLGSVLFIVVFVVVGAFAGIDPEDPEAAVAKFPDIRTARIVENSLYLLVLVLWTCHFLALYRVLRQTSLAPALFGSVLGILGLGVLAAGALPHLATGPISDLYHASGATPEDRATLAFLWAATQGIFDALFVAGLLILLAGVVALGIAMLDAPAFGIIFGRVTVVLGLLGLVGACVLLVEVDSATAVFGVFTLIGFHLAAGWRLYGLSKAT